MKKCPHCAEDIQDDAKKCKHCGEWLSDDKKIEPTVIKELKGQNEKKLEGFQGWLTFFGLGIFIAPIIIFLNLTSGYRSLNAFDIILNILIILMYLYLIYLMVGRKKIFKRWFIGVGIFQVLLAILVAIGANSQSQLFTAEEISDINRNIWGSLVYLIAWTGYLNNSKRVKNTFIN